MSYIVLYSTVFVFTEGTKTLLYDSNTGIYLKYETLYISQLFHSRINKSLNVFIVTNENHDEIILLIRDILTTKMGWFAKKCKNPPFQMAPLVGVNELSDNAKDCYNTPFSKTIFGASRNVIRLTIYMDGNTDYLYNPLNKIKQTLFCDPKINITSRININVLINNLKQINKLIYLQELNIICNCLEENNEYKYFIDFICKSVVIQTKVYIVCDIYNLITNEEMINELLDTHHNLYLKIIVDSKCKNDSYFLYLDKLKEKKFFYKSIIFVLVYSESDLCNKSTCYNIPIFDGTNKHFFEQNVFLEESDIKETFISMQDIFRRQLLNEHYFGNVIIMNEGDVYLNLFEEKIGNIYEDNDIISLLSNTKSMNSWYLTRDKVQPCKHCVYKYLCPSISNYEFILKKMNLCKNVLSQ